ncbi:MAG TPA: ABC transporter permease [Pyrinomonadaceae bacterium]|nr:ABC transporter permease [Pyrinomonadaceae bacterium]
MRGEMLKAMLWKEWRETRWKWLAFAVAFHIPLIIAGLVVAFKPAARFDLMAFNDTVVERVLQGTLVVQTIFLISAGLFLLAFYAVGAVGGEIENRSIFFLFERPVHRRQILAVKYAVGATQTVACVALSIVTTLALVYLVTAGAASGVTLAGSWGAFASVMDDALRGALWTGLVALMVFSATFLFSVLFEKWWIAVIAGAVALIAMFYYFGADLFNLIVSQALRNSNGGNANLDVYGRLDPYPMLIMLITATVLYFTAQYFFARKEMK